MVIPLRNEGLRKGERYLSPEEWEAKKRGCSAMVEQHLKPSYNTLMKKLGIEIIGTEKAHICNSNSVKNQKDKKTGIKLKNLTGLKFDDSCTYFLTFQDSYFYISLSHKSDKRGCFTHKNSVTTNK